MTPRFFAASEPSTPPMIKMCGMTREVDVEYAVRLGVDAVGFVLWEGSPRRTTFERAAVLARLVPAHVATVAVLVHADADQVSRALDDLGCSGVQLHGHVEPAVLDTLASCVIRTTSLAGDRRLLGAGVDEVPLLLLDAHDPERHGGTGQVIDWAAARTVAAARRIILAGGLTAANVGEAVRTVRPFAVDVASGIEARPGIKDPDAMQAFVTAVRSTS